MTLLQQLFLNAFLIILIYQTIRGNALLIRSNTETLKSEILMPVYTLKESALYGDSKYICFLKFSFTYKRLLLVLTTHRGTKPP
jgi:hypothetical protein